MKVMMMMTSPSSRYAAAHELAMAQTCSIVLDMAQTCPNVRDMAQTCPIVLDMSFCARPGLDMAQQSPVQDTAVVERSDGQCLVEPCCLFLLKQRFLYFLLVCQYSTWTRSDLSVLNDLPVLPTPQLHVVSSVISELVLVRCMILRNFVPILFFFVPIFQRPHIRDF